MLPGDDFWEQSGIPLEKRTEFIQYLIGKNYQRKAIQRTIELAALPLQKNSENQNPIHNMKSILFLCLLLFHGASMHKVF